MTDIATVTPDMITCLAEMQQGEIIKSFIDHLDEIQERLLEDEDESPENLLSRIHLMKENRFYRKCLKRFICKEGDNNE